MSEPSAPSPWRRAIWLLRFVGTAAGILYVARLVSVDELAAAARRMNWWALAGAVALVAANVAIGAVRWRVLLDAYGAIRPPPVTRLTRLYFVAFFYNNYLPGAVAGDVIRGVATREAFGAQGLTANLTVVLVERALGLFALFALLAAGLIGARGVAEVADLWLWTAVGIAGAFGIVLAIAYARRLAPHLPGTLRGLAERLPAIVRMRAFASATALSLGTQVFAALAGWVVLVALEPSVGFGASLLVVPLAAATSFLPITVGGAGAREAVYVTMCGRLFGMSSSDALIAALGFWLANLIVGGLGILGQIGLASPARAETRLSGR